MNEKKNTEIEYTSFFEIIVNGKWKILAITIITTIMGLYYSLTKQNSFQFSTQIYPGQDSAFIKYMSMSEILREHSLFINDKVYSIVPSKIFEMFINEFSDKQEMIKVLAEDSSVKKSVHDLSDKDKLIALTGLSKMFTIPKAKKKSKDRFLNFSWHNPTNGLDLLNKGLHLTLQNIKKNLINDVNGLAALIEKKQKRKLKKLQDEIKVIRQTQLLEKALRIIFLTEHSEIAKDLNIKNNMLDANALNKSKNSKFIPPTSNILLPQTHLENSPNKINDFPYYLRGFKAIDKEISLIKNRTKEEQLLMAGKYLLVKNEILLTEIDASASQLRNYSKILEKDDPYSWININTAIGNISSFNKKSLYIVLSVMLGLILGLIYAALPKIIKFENKK